MQAQPYTVVTGTVVATRRVDVPAREASSGTRADGTTYQTRASEAVSYCEVAINAPAVINGQSPAGLSSIFTVRQETGDKLPDDGQTVTYGVTASVAKAFIRGRFVEWVVYNRAVDLTTAPARELAGAGAART